MVDLRHFLPKPEAPVLVIGVYRLPGGKHEIRLQNGMHWQLTEAEADTWTETMQRVALDRLLGRDPQS